MTPLLVAGIDPGTARIGYALVYGNRFAPELRRAETIIVSGAGGPGERLRALAQALRGRLRRDRPDVVAIEKLYFSRNAKTALAVAEARGIIILTASELIPSIWEYAPLTVKLAVTGYGRADKAHVHRAVLSTLAQRKTPHGVTDAELQGLGDDAIDAIAIALTAVYTKPNIR